MFTTPLEEEKNYLVSLAWKALISTRFYACTLSEAEAMEALEEALEFWLASEASDYNAEAMEEAWGEAIAEAESMLHELCKRDDLGPLFCRL